MDPITGVPTSVAAVVGGFARGPLHRPQGVSSWADFEASFGGLHADSPASYAVRQFFLNGGRELWVVRAGTGEPDEGSPDTAALVAALPALDSVDLFNLLLLPDTDRLPDADAARVAEAATAYAHARRALYILDLPSADTVRDTVPAIVLWLDAHDHLRHENVAAYVPRPVVADPLAALAARAIPASGSVAGVYARTDAARGVWKAPAGTQATLAGVLRLEHEIDDAGSGVLNPLGMNALRTFRSTGPVIWGARTLAGADRLGSEWKYVPVRRLALLVEESLLRGTRFAVFEPNGEPLWAQIRQSIGAFMEALFRQGAFQGRSSREAWFVKCDGETTTQGDLDAGVVNVIVGFAPSRPAEFVVLHLRQRTAQAPA